jgi:hypothetical protein
MLELVNSVQPARIPETKAMITERIRGEFREMPGLTLTAEQACRLWSLDMPTCTETLSLLIDAGYLCRKSDGAYGRATDLAIRPRMAKAGMQFLEIDRPKRAAAEG